LNAAKKIILLLWLLIMASLGNVSASTPGAPENRVWQKSFETLATRLGEPLQTAGRHQENGGAGYDYAVDSLLAAENSAIVAQEGGLRAAAMDAHNALANPIAIQNSAVAVVEADVSGIGTTYYASGSGAYLSPAQRASLIASGVPEENIFSGAAFASANQLENHAEQVILRNIPEDATINGWGISWTTDQRPIPCPNCAPFVQNAGGIIQGR
jgi:hypothetical protein